MKKLVAKLISMLDSIEKMKGIKKHFFQSLVDASFALSLLGCLFFIVTFGVWTIKLSFYLFAFYLFVLIVILLTLIRFINGNDD